MKKTILVNVIRENIRKGVPRTLGKCPVALAVRRATGQRAYIDEEEWSLDDGLCGDHSRSVQRFIKRLDAGKSVKPFSFFLKLATNRRTIGG